MDRYTIPLTISLPASLIPRIDDAAKNNNQPRSHWLRDAALARLKAEPAPAPASAADAALRQAALDRTAAQLTGCAHAGIGDPSCAVCDPRMTPQPSAARPLAQADIDALLSEINGGADAK